MIRGMLALVIVAVACTEGRSANTGGDDAIAGKLVGAWDATMTLDRPYPLQPRSSEARTICGTIGVIEQQPDLGEREAFVGSRAGRWRRRRWRPAAAGNRENCRGKSRHDQRSLAEHRFFGRGG